MREINEQTAIRNLQRYLRQLSYTDTDVPPVPIDGIFDTATRDSLMSFQKKYDLEQSGVADRETWDMLYSKYLESLADNAVPKGFSPFYRVPKGETLSLGDKNFGVAAVQYMLNEISVINDALPILDITGVFDNATERAVAIFQSSAPLDVTGQVNLATWNAIVDAFDSYANDYVQ